MEAPPQRRPDANDIVHYSIHSCPRCGQLTEIRMLDMCSGLGPRRAICFACGYPRLSGRDEWASHRTAKRVAIFAYLVLASIGSGVLLSMFLVMPFGLWNELHGLPKTHFPDIVAMATPPVLLILTTQMARIRSSIARTERSPIRSSSSTASGASEGPELPASHIDLGASGTDALDTDPPVRPHSLLRFGWQALVLAGMLVPLLVSFAVYLVSLIGI